MGLRFDRQLRGSEWYHLAVEFLYSVGGGVSVMPMQ